MKVSVFNLLPTAPTSPEGRRSRAALPAGEAVFRYGPDFFGAGTDKVGKHGEPRVRILLSPAASRVRT